MSWSDSVSSFISEINSIQSQLQQLGASLTVSCRGIGEQQINQALSALSQKLDKAKQQLDQSR